MWKKLKAEIWADQMNNLILVLYNGYLKTEL